jgi:hypothetical protein
MRGQPLLTLQIANLEGKIDYRKQKNATENVVVG